MFDKKAVRNSAIRQREEKEVTLVTTKEEMYKMGQITIEELRRDQK